MKTHLISLLCLMIFFACGDKPNIDRSRSEVGSPSSLGERTYRSGSDGTELSEDWSSLDSPGMNNARVKSLRVLKLEVKYSLGVDWVKDNKDQWEEMSSALGEADYKTSWKTDRFPSQQKMAIFRDMARATCKAAVGRDSLGTPALVFSRLNPSKASDQNAREIQFRDLFFRLLKDEPSEELLAKGLDLFSAVQQSDGDALAWEMICASLLSSMRFLTY